MSIRRHPKSVPVSAKRQRQCGKLLGESLCLCPDAGLYRYLHGSLSLLRHLRWRILFPLFPDLHKQAHLQSHMQRLYATDRRAHLSRSGQSSLPPHPAISDLPMAPCATNTNILATFKTLIRTIHELISNPRTPTVTAASQAFPSDASKLRHYPTANMSALRKYTEEKNTSSRQYLCTPGKREEVRVCTGGPTLAG